MRARGAARRRLPRPGLVPGGEVMGEDWWRWALRWRPGARRSRCRGAEGECGSRSSSVCPGATVTCAREHDGRPDAVPVAEANIGERRRTPARSSVGTGQFSTYPGGVGVPVLSDVHVLRLAPRVEGTFVVAQGGVGAAQPNWPASPSTPPRRQAPQGRQDPATGRRLRQYAAGCRGCGSRSPVPAGRRPVGPGPARPGT